MLAHKASAEALTAVENICGGDSRMDYRTIPSCVYLDPEVASVGLTEEQAKERYRNTKSGIFPLSANGKSKIENEKEGIVKIVAQGRYNEIVGVHLLCRHATEMISEASLAIGLECRAEELAALVHPHPTLSEAIGEAAHALISSPIHL
jgi:dihydrolipoamide dehydrogenase